VDRPVIMTVVGSARIQTTLELAELGRRGRAERVRSVDALAHGSPLLKGEFEECHCSP